jgi:hypothetical protein
MLKDTTVDVAAELRAAKLELVTAEAQEAEIRAEFRPLVEEKVAAELDGKPLSPQKERRISVLRGKLDEAMEILEARRGRVRQLHLLAVNKDVTAARDRQHGFVAEVARESEKVAPLLRELEAIRRRIAEIADVECNFIRSLNFQLGLEGRDRLQERLRGNFGGVTPPHLVDAEVWSEYATRQLKGLADF